MAVPVQKRQTAVYTTTSGNTILDLACFIGFHMAYLKKIL